MERKSKTRFNPFLRLTAGLILITYIFNYVLSPVPASAQSMIGLPAPGSMVPLSASFTPFIMKGVVTYPDNPLKMDFLMDKADSHLTDEQLKAESLKQVKYFLAALTVPEEDMWVNLSPHEKNRIIPEKFSYTDMGKDLLAQDYILKQIAASLVYPEEQLGRDFWEKIYAKVGVANGEMNSLNKVWVVPADAEVYVHGNSAFVVSSKLDVLLDKDYVKLREKLDNGYRPDESAASQETYLEALKETILPEIKKEVNQGHNFAVLRQVYNAMILATWFKRNLRESLLGKVYVGKNTVDGIDIEDKKMREKIYEQYLEAFKQGVYDYIKEEYDPQMQEVVLKKHFSGGIEFTRFMGLTQGTVFRETTNPGRGQLVQFDQAMVASIGLSMTDQSGNKHEMNVNLQPPKLPLNQAQQLPDAASMAFNLSVDVQPFSKDDSIFTGLTKDLPKPVKPVEPSKWKKRLGNNIRVSLLSMGLFFSSFLITSSTEAATFHRNAQGNIVAVIQDGDNFGKVVEQMRVDYKNLDEDGYKNSALYGNFGKVLSQTKGMIESNTGSPNLNKLKPDQELTFSSALELPVEGDNQTSQSAQLTPTPTQGGLHENDQTNFDGSIQNTPNRTGDIPGEKFLSAYKNVSQVEKTSFGTFGVNQVNHFMTSIKGHEFGFLQLLTALGLLTFTLFRSLSSGGKGSASGGSSGGGGGGEPPDADVFKRKQLEVFIHSQIIQGNPVYTSISSNIQPVLDDLSSYFELELSSKVDAQEAGAKRSQTIRREFGNVLGEHLSDVIYSQLDWKAINKQINQKVDDLSGRYTGFQNQSNLLARDINKFVSGELKTFVDVEVEGITDQLKEKLLGEQWINIYKRMIDVVIQRSLVLNSKIEELIPDIVKSLKEFMKGQGLVPSSFEDISLQQENSTPFVEKETQSQRLLESKKNKRSSEKNVPWKEDAFVTMATGIVSLMTGTAGVGTLLATGLAPFAYRLGLVANQWFHEMGHMVKAGKSAVTANNLKANVSGKQWLKMLVPFWGQIPSEDEFGVRVNNTSEIQDKEIRYAGFRTSLFLVAAQFVALNITSDPTTVNFLFPFSLAAFWTTLQSAKTDMIDQWLGKIKQGFYKCGIVALAKAREEGSQEQGFQEEAGQVEIISENGMTIFTNGVRRTDIRGQQAGGGATLAEDENGQVHWVGKRTVNRKRQDLPENMETKILKAVKSAERKGWHGVSGVEIMLGHVRYGTSSKPKENETHPHQWMADRDVKHWSISDENLRPGQKTLGIKIAHNGDLDYLGQDKKSIKVDFDYFNLFDKWISNGTLGLLLERILQTPNDTEGDSPKIAGVMDLLATQGIWNASARLGYYFTIPESMKEIFGDQEPSKTAPNTTLSNDALQELANVFESEFEQRLSSLMMPNAKSLKDLWVTEKMVEMDDVLKEQFRKLQEFKLAIENRLKMLELSQGWGEKKLKNFVELSTKAFFNNDLLTAVQEFADRSDHPSNTFGLVVGSTLQPDGYVLYARGQPLMVGIDEKRHAVMAVSEPGAVKVKDLNGEYFEDRFALEQRYRGEIIHVAITPWEQGKTKTPFTVYSRDLNRFLSEDEVIERYEPLPPKKSNPHITMPVDLDKEDPVSDDISEIPNVLKNIRDDWRNPDSHNRLSSEHMLMRLIQKVVEREIKRSSTSYGQISGRIVEHARFFASEWSDVLRESIDGKFSEESWKVDADIDQEFSPVVQRYMEGVFYKNFDHRRIKREINDKALDWAVELLKKDKDENKVLYELNGFIRDQLDHVIDETMVQAQAKTKVFNQKIEAYFQSRMTLALDVTLAGEFSTVDALVIQAGEQVKSIFKELGIQPGQPFAKETLDVYITGIEISLWMGEQFGLDLKHLLRGLKVGTGSANKLLEGPEELGIDEDTIVLVISQSGQTFGSLFATIVVDGQEKPILKSELERKVTERLNHISPGRTFVLTGEEDTLMGRAVGQRFQADAPPSRRIFTNLTGMRPAEASSITGVATHATLNEILMNLGSGLNEIFPEGKAFHMQLEKSDFTELQTKADVLIAEAERAVGIDRDGDAIKSKEYEQIIKTSNVWSKHVLDPPIARIMTYIHLYAAVVGGFVAMDQLAGLSPVPIPPLIINHLQFGLYAMFPSMAVWVKRLFDKRTVLARTGNRTLVIGGHPMVHQTLEMFVSKLFSLSKSSTALDVHGANPDDHMVHRFGHRIVRGSLIWMGLPDARLKKLQRMNNAYLMTAKQAMGVQDFGVGAEVAIVGRERSYNPNASSVDITIEGEAATQNEKIQMLFYNRYETLLQLIVGDVFFNNMAKQVSTLGVSKKYQWLWPWNWKRNRTKSGTRTATTASPKAPAPGAVNSGGGDQALLSSPLEIKPVITSADVTSSQTITPSGENAPGGIDMSSRWLRLKESVSDSTGESVPPSLNLIEPINRLTPFILEIKPMTPVGINFLLGLNQEDFKNGELSFNQLENQKHL